MFTREIYLENSVCVCVCVYGLRNLHFNPEIDQMSTEQHMRNGTGQK